MVQVIHRFRRFKGELRAVESAVQCIEKEEELSSYNTFGEGKNNFHCGEFQFAAQQQELGRTLFYSR